MLSTITLDSQVWSNVVPSMLRGVKVIRFCVKVIHDTRMSSHLTMELLSDWRTLDERRLLAKAKVCRL